MQGFPIEVIEKDSRPEDVEPHIMFGRVYRVPVKYKGRRHEDVVRSGTNKHAAAANKQAPPAKPQMLAPAEVNDVEAELAEDDSEEEDSSEYSDSSSSSEKKKKKKKKGNKAKLKDKNKKKRKAQRDKETARKEEAKEKARKRIEQAEQKMWNRRSNLMLPKTMKLKATLEAQLEQREISSIPMQIVKPLVDQFDMLKQQEEVLAQVIDGDFENASDMIDNATFVTTAKDIQKALTLLTQLVCAVRKQQLEA